MFKKLMSAVIILVLLTVACVVPVSATDLADSLVYDLDFSDGITDVNGVANKIEIPSGDVSYQYNEEIKMDTIEILADTQIKLKGADIMSFTELTYELYFKITATEGEIAILRFTNGECELVALPESGYFGLGYNGTILTEPLERGTWLHIVCSIKNGEQFVYINGEEAGSSERTDISFGQGSSSSTSYIGSWARDTGVEIADLKLYEAAVSREEAKAMYAAVSGEETTTPTEEPSVTEEPTEEPTETEAPTAEPTKKPSTPTEKPVYKDSDGLSGTTIAIIVVAAVVVIAGVAVAIILVMKKKKAK